MSQPPVMNLSDTLNIIREFIPEVDLYPPGAVLKSSIPTMDFEPTQIRKINGEWHVEVTITERFFEQSSERTFTQKLWKGPGDGDIFAFFNGVPGYLFSELKPVKLER